MASWRVSEKKKKSEVELSLSGRIEVDIEPTNKILLILESVHKITIEALTLSLVLILSRYFMD